MMQLGEGSERKPAPADELISRLFVKQSEIFVSREGHPQPAASKEKSTLPVISAGGLIRAMAPPPLP